MLKNKKMLKNILFIGLIAWCSIAIAQAPKVAWQQNFGGEQQETINKMIALTNGDYLLVGSTESIGNGQKDMWVTVLNGKGATVWEKTYGGEKNEEATDVWLNKKDNSVLLLGYTESKGEGNRDVTLLKLDNKGEVIWEKTYGDASSNVGFTLTPTKNGGFLITSSEQISQRVKTEGVIKLEMDHYAWLFEIDKEGEMLWENTFRTPDVVSITATSATDDGFVCLANTKFEGKKHGNMWLFKVDEKGKRTWEQIFEGATFNNGNAMVQTKDKGFAIAGVVYTNGMLNGDAWLVKVNKKGAFEWDQRFGGEGTDYTSCLSITNDGGFILGGINNSGKTYGESMWLVKTNKKGTKEWETTFGKLYTDIAAEVLQLRDNSYIVAGYTQTRVVPQDDTKEAYDANNAPKVYGDALLFKMK